MLRGLVGRVGVLEGEEAARHREEDDPATPDIAERRHIVPGGGLRTG